MLCFRSVQMGKYELSEFGLETNVKHDLPIAHRTHGTT
jgi:hypothetical protein